MCYWRRQHEPLLLGEHCRKEGTEEQRNKWLVSFSVLCFPTVASVHHEYANGAIALLSRSSDCLISKDWITECGFFMWESHRNQTWNMEQQQVEYNIWRQWPSHGLRDNSKGEIIKCIFFKPPSNSVQLVLAAILEAMTRNRLDDSQLFVCFF